MPTGHLPLRAGDAVPLGQDEADQVLAAAAIEVEHGTAAYPIPAWLSPVHSPVKS
jgi:hypothetical protein